ncbi:carboxypeptidase-like regulatory domain-containing protein [Hymenobacter sp. BT683]|uniref:Carboxypeptidase-like regulatory domain-containing protein n=1 Tax=Hymenobacter jeongseonensis TaxID=2791027 RepID=A0ABS0II72_9BACT|nr:carboxypeptidase-like regulatory domain-containing protein [Hymenobacter jeongseonensis]MBF9237623.1 carboxypeptidase-like regulatory domain-containing protein [Hymenobacter jeongseonensis]
MNPENLQKAEPEQYDPNLDAQDEEVVSGGNNRLLYVLLAVVVALVIGYVALPKGGGDGIASVTPSFMLDDAAVTGTTPTAADSIAAGLKAAPVAKEEEEEEKTTAKPSEKAALAAKTVAPAAGPVAVAAPVAAAPAPAPEPVPEAAPAPAPEPAAPAFVTMSGKIEDENGRPMVGATVLLKGSSKGTSTDASGNYSFEVPNDKDHTLVFGYGGYEDEVVRSSGSRPVNVTLTPRAKAGRSRR